MRSLWFKRMLECGNQELEEVRMATVSGLDVRRGIVSFTYMNTEIGEVVVGLATPCPAVNVPPRHELSADARCRAPDPSSARTPDHLTLGVRGSRHR